MRFGVLPRIGACAMGKRAGVRVCLTRLTRARAMVRIRVRFRLGVRLGVGVGIECRVV